MALTDWAVYRLDDGFIDNVIWFDADTAQWTPPEGHGMVDIPGNGSYAGKWSMCGIGWSYINGQFVEPPNPNAETTLTANVTATDTTLPVVDATTFFPSGYLLIDKEWVTYTGTTPTSFTGVTRGVNGTTAAAYLSGTTVQYFSVASNQPVAEGVQTL